MTSLTALAVAAAALVFSAAAEYYRHLDDHLIRRSGRQLLVGLLAGALIAWLAIPGASGMALSAVVLTVAAILLNREGHGADRLDALFSGSVVGGVAALVLVGAGSKQPCEDAARMILASVAASVGASSIEGSLGRRTALTAATFAATLAGTALPAGAVAAGAPPIAVAIAAAAVPSLFLAGSVVFRRRTILRELAEEADLGVLPAGEVASVAHPVRRLARCGWPSRDARRRFVTLATDLALQKRRQRSLPPQPARLQQLEILQTRMELKEVLLVNHLMNRDLTAEGEDAKISSDTIGIR